MTQPTTTPPHQFSSVDATLAADLPAPELLKRFASDVSSLIATEMSLARAEITAQMPKVQQSAGLFGAATLLGLGAFFALTIAIIAGLALATGLWLAALIVAVVYGAIAAIAAKRGSSNIESIASPVPKVAESIRADVASIKTGLERGR